MTPAVPDLTCRELVELVTDHVEGDLPVDTRTRLELHLTRCSGCRTYLAQMRQVVEAAGGLREEWLAPGARDALLGIFRHWKKGAGGNAGG